MTSKLCSCAFFDAHVSAPYTYAGLTTGLSVPNTFPLHFPFIVLSHNNLDSLPVLPPTLHLVGDVCIQILVIRHSNVFILFTVSRYKLPHVATPQTGVEVVRLASSCCSRASKCDPRATVCLTSGGVEMVV